MTSTRDAGFPVIELSGVSFAYGAEPVLRNVSCVVERGDFIAVVGPNGGGKTTLLKMMLGLLRPQQGRVRIFGQAPRRSRRRLGYMPQQALLDIAFPVSVFDMVLMGRLGREGWGWRHGPGDRKAAFAALKRVGLDRGSAEEPFASLSGGQRQRALIARALAAEPEVLLLDEPTANVDPAAEGEIYHFLRHLNERLTIVVVSHDLGLVSPEVGRVMCVVPGGRVAIHTTGEVTGEVIAQVFGRPMRVVHHDFPPPGDEGSCGHD